MMRRFAVLTMALMMPTMTFAATPAMSSRSSSTEVSKEDIVKKLVEDPAVEPAKPVARPQSGGGDAAMMDESYAKRSSIIMPPYYGGNGVTIDVQVTKEVTPDVITLNAWCQLPESGNRQQVRTELDALYLKLKNVVGTDGRIRKQGGYSINPVYDYTGKTSSMFQGNLNVLIRIAKTTATKRIADAVEDAGCGTGWDVRMQDMQEQEMAALDQLLTKLNTRKQVFEKLLGKKLTVVTSANLNTYIDGYSSYDPDTNTAEAITTLNVTFDLGTNTRLPVPTPLRK